MGGLDDTTEVPAEETEEEDDTETAIGRVNRHGVLLAPVSGATYVALHNARRRLHGVPDVEWSEDAAASARSWAKNGLYRFCPDNQYGENMYRSATQPDPSVVVSAWYDEIRNYDFEHPGPKEDAGQFTQLVWKNTRGIGCAMCRTKDGQWLVFCHYDPPGNFTRQIPDNVLPLIQPESPTSGTESDQKRSRKPSLTVAVPDSRREAVAQGFASHSSKDAPSPSAPPKRSPASAPPAPAATSSAKSSPSLQRPASVPVAPSPKQPTAKPKTKAAPAAAKKPAAAVSRPTTIPRPTATVPPSRKSAPVVASSPVPRSSSEISGTGTAATEHTAATATPTASARRDSLSTTATATNPTSESEETTGTSDTEGSEDEPAAAAPTPAAAPARRNHSAPSKHRGRPDTHGVPTDTDHHAPKPRRAPRHNSTERPVSPNFPTAHPAESKHRRSRSPSDRHAESHTRSSKASRASRPPLPGSPRPTGHSKHNGALLPTLDTRRSSLTPSLPPHGPADPHRHRRPSSALDYFGHPTAGHPEESFTLMDSELFEEFRSPSLPPAVAAHLLGPPRAWSLEDTMRLIEGPLPRPGLPLLEKPEPHLPPPPETMDAATYARLERRIEAEVQRRLSIRRQLELQELGGHLRSFP